MQNTGGQGQGGYPTIDPRLTSTAFEIPLFTIKYNLGVVRGVTVRSRSIAGQIGAAFQSLGGGNITLLTELAEQARAEAYGIMVAHALQQGANAIIGIRYDSSLMDDDKPYRLATASGTIAELPVHWSLDDWEQYAFLPDPDIGQQIESPRKVVELWTAELDAMRETKSLCVLTCHPFLSGRPSRARAIEEFIEFALDRGDVRFSRADHLADIVLADQAKRE